MSIEELSEKIETLQEEIGLLSKAEDDLFNLSPDVHNCGMPEESAKIDDVCVSIRLRLKRLRNELLRTEDELEGYDEYKVQQSYWDKFVEV